MHEKIKEKGLKVTGPRVSILSIFEKSNIKHLSAEEIYQNLQAQHNPVSFGTVYRVLTQFEQAGILKKQSFIENRGVVYELTEDEAPHHHFICLKTGEIQEFSDEILSARIAQIADQKGWEISEYHINIYGLSKKNS